MILRKERHNQVASPRRARGSRLPTAAAHNRNIGQGCLMNFSGGTDLTVERMFDKMGL